MKKDSTIDRTD